MTGVLPTVAELEYESDAESPHTRGYSGFSARDTYSAERKSITAAAAIVPYINNKQMLNGTGGSSGESLGASGGRTQSGPVAAGVPQTTVFHGGVQEPSGSSSMLSLASTRVVGQADRTLSTSERVHDYRIDWTGLCEMDLTRDACAMPFALHYLGAG
ncbi:hypothetical protein GLOTRDRAFT_96494 [Gloeophyllum trabeum ATCC 11539]|uniref:Uncharacterized protein n=1 Tax=Gloeophyllum trabeum (strain ATCC 11539 / FP-39264 / Madison 617) TaxID=670483 RepID=S7PV95_GLOTA|nr:uncharacterized protein GLOTRDRAFT_96494 [Gloeophyllum trabeum ATCC 11539]EPQ51332.1 hypothetical protein GLOTRDRAFT_96494 [Gloeophyllum trabeum ATCC 11539]